MGEQIDYAGLFGVSETGSEEPVAEEPSRETAQETPAQTPEEPDTAPEGAAAGEDSGSAGEPGAEEGQEPCPAPRVDREQVIADARQEAMREATEFLNGAIAELNMVDPYTKQPIRTKAEYDVFYARHQDEQRKKFQKANGMSDEQFQRFVEELPQVRQANEAKAQAEREQRSAREQQARARLEEQVKAIGRLDPGVTDLKSLTESEGYDRVYALVQKGYELADAYKIVHFERLSQRNVAAAKQQALNAAQGKGHLTQTPARGSGAVAVPADVKEQYRLFWPGATDAEIQQHYEKNHRK